MELTPSEKDELLRRLAARTPRQIDPARDITIDELRRTIERQQGRKVSRSTIERLVNQAVEAGELTRERAVQHGRLVYVYRSAP